LRRSNEKRGIKCRVEALKLKRAKLRGTVYLSTKILRNIKNARGASLFAAESVTRELRDSSILLIRFFSGLARFRSICQFAGFYYVDRFIIVKIPRYRFVLLFNKSTRTHRAPLLPLRILFPLLILQSRYYIIPQMRAILAGLPSFPEF